MYMTNFLNFRNLFPVLRNAAVFQGLIDVLVESIKTKFPEAEVIVGKIKCQSQFTRKGTLASCDF